MLAGHGRRFAPIQDRFHPDDAKAYDDVKDPVCDIIIEMLGHATIQTTVEEQLHKDVQNHAL